jgi:2-polyprenyl-3-methyl-5-hydroxy-6-metoxy-1,4-benzoquinol methylase
VLIVDEKQLIDELKKYNFFHIIKLTENLSTSGDPDAVPIQDVALRALRTIDLKDKRVLDIGCRDGLFSFEAEKLGAREVIGIDNDLSLGAVNLLIPYLKSNVKMYELNLMDLTPETFGMFDVVIFAGVLYHLRYPFWALKRIKDVLHEGGKLIVETAINLDDNSRAMLFCPLASDSPYGITNCTFFNIKGLVDTLSSLELVTHETELLYTPKMSNSTNLLSTVKSRIKSLKLVKPYIKPYVDRLTLVCSKQSQNEAALLNEYWNSTHNTFKEPLE